MFKRLFDFFKRDKPKQKLLKETYNIPMPKPKEVKAVIKHFRRRGVLQSFRNTFLKKEIKRGKHIAYPKHIHKPLKMNFQRTDFSVSADLHIDRILGKVPSRKAERVELGIIKN